MGSDGKPDPPGQSTSRGPPPPLPPRPGPPPLPPNKPVFLPPPMPQYFPAPQYPPPPMYEYNHPTMFHAMNPGPGYYPAAHPLYHPSQPGAYPPNIFGAPQFPAQMPPHPQSHPYFAAQQHTGPAGIIPPVAFTGSAAFSMPAVVQLPHPVPPVVDAAMPDSPSYQWPDGSVKLECTVGQEPLGWDDEGWKWRSSGFRRKGIPPGAFKVDKRVCLGVFRCDCKKDDGLPGRFFRPKTAKKARDKQHNETCSICRSKLVYISCDCSLMYYQYRDEEGETYAVRQHIGRHLHGRPPLTRLAAKDVEALDFQVLHNPQATAQQLRAAAEPGQVPLGEINPILMDARKARSEVEKSKVRQHLIPSGARNSGFQFLDSFTALKESFETPWIVEAELLDRQFICMQTPFMRDVLLRDSVQSWHAENLEAESGRHGVITDGTFDFFKQGVLLTSLVFSQVLFRWVVVLYTWIGGQDGEHHLPHFKQLVHVIAEICTKGLGFTFDDRIFSSILDFSNAQRNGFIDAFVEYMCSRIPGWNELSAKSQNSERASFRVRAHALLLGCKVHWRRSTHKIKQVIGVAFLFRFESLVAILEGASTTGEQFLQAVADIHGEFPEVRPWLSWWIIPGNGGMVFPAMQRMSAEMRARMPSSTNGAESSHHLLYGAAGKHHDMNEGVRRLYRVQRETEMLYEAVLAGHVRPRFQGLKPNPMSRLTLYSNDGRAPDTRERLAAVAQLEADLITQKKALTEAERFAAANSASNSAPAAQVGTPQRSVNQQLLQSYKWDANSCFIDASLEAYFRVFASMPDAVRAELLRRIRTECRGTGLQDVFEHFWLRGLHSGAVASNDKSTSEKSTKKDNPNAIQTKLIAALYAGQKNVKRLIETKWDKGRFVAGMVGCARTWPTQMIQFETTLRVQHYFSPRYKLKYICASNHVTDNFHPDMCFEFPVHRHDLALAQAYIKPGAENPSLADLLAHSVPWECFGGPRSHSRDYIHRQRSALPCPHLACNDSQAPLVSISTEWPLILRVMPVFPRVDGDLPFKDVYCPLTLELGSGVEYELISRVLYRGPTGTNTVGHYTTQTRVGDRSYVYNDCVRDGLLADLGPLCMLEDVNPLAISAIYLLRSRSSSTTRSRAELEADCVKVPPRPAASVVDDDEQEQWIQDLYNDPVSKMRLEYKEPQDPAAKMILDSLDGPETPPAYQENYSDEDEPSPAKSDSTNSTTPCPIYCHGCGLVSDECLSDDVDWDDPNIEFVCARCQPRLEADLFNLNEIVMLPYPAAPDWKADDVLWYPARFVKRGSAGTAREFKFKWLQCDWLIRTDPDAFPNLIPQTYQRGREFCEEVSSVVLKSSQIGKIRLPSYMEPEMSAPDDHPLIGIFAGSVTRLSVVLGDFNPAHPVIGAYTQFFAKKNSSARDTEAAQWLSNLRLSPTPELESLMQAPIQELLGRVVFQVGPTERRRRVLSVGSALLQLLAIQHELGEELNLNGDTFEDLLDGSIVPRRIDGTKALEAMFLSTNPLELKHRKRWDLDRFSQHMSIFHAAHTVYDPALCPPRFERTSPSLNLPKHPILFDIAAASVAPAIIAPIENSETVGQKRGNDGETLEEPAPKRGKKSTTSRSKPPAVAARRSGRLAGGGSK
ncbi:hypothetical protein DFH06DRAFT_1401711 [Mycena polygramma]|nr:hypothetical protein DFH06DRAFT_1401711 [Mycena polygramma]